MTTSRAILASALLISASVTGSAWIITQRAPANERYQIVNTGSGSTVRLDRETGDLVRCDASDCASMIKGGKVVAASVGDDIPAPPSGFTIVK